MSEVNQVEPASNRKMRTVSSVVLQIWPPTDSSVDRMEPSWCSGRFLLCLQFLTGTGSSCCFMYGTRGIDCRTMKDERHPAETSEGAERHGDAT